MAPLLNLLHIPKTGGTALDRALNPRAHRQGHNKRLEDMPLWPPIVAVVRDPVARWVSAWDMCFRQRHVAQFDRWPDASTAACDPDCHVWLAEAWGVVFHPMTHWLRDARYALRRCWYIAHTETLDDDFLTIRDAIGAAECEMPTHQRHRNANPGAKSVLSPEAEAAIREHYAADYELLEAL